MRDIKFRGKRIDNGEWTYGSYLQSTTGICLKHYIYSTAFGNEVDLSTVGQYTGLKDKNGREVYEGDIVQPYSGKMKYGISEIKYIGRSFCMSQNFDDTEMDCVWFYDFEIIGNIHDTPELLKEDGR